MRHRRATLRGMDLEQLDRILAFVADVIDRTGGDYDATEAAIREKYRTDDELEMALDTYATVLVIVYRKPGGPAMVRGIRDDIRGLVPALPAGAPGRGWWPRRRQPA